VPHYQGETAVGHHLTEIVGVTNETVHAVGNEPALDAQREVLLGVGGDHEHAARNAQTDAKAEPNIIGQRVARPRHAGDQQPTEYPVPAEHAEKAGDASTIVMRL